MRLSRRFPRLSWAWLCVAATACAGSPSPPPHDLVLRNVTVVDVESGALTAGVDVAIDDGSITRIVPAGADAIDARQLVDGAGAYVVPGLWDMHVHLADPAYLRLFVSRGVVGVRDMGGGLDAAGDGCESLKPSILRAWRREIEAGERVGPEVVVAGPAVSGTGWATSLPATSPAEAVEAVGHLRQSGVDFIKIHERVPRDAFLALADEAKRNHLPFAGHLVDEVTPAEAILAGQRSIEHVRDQLLVCFTGDPAEFEGFLAEDRWGAGDRAWGRQAHGRCPATFDALRGHDTWLTPTLAVEKAKVAVDDVSHATDPRRQSLPDSVRAGYAAYVQEMHARDPVEHASQYLWWRTQKAFVKRANALGAKLLAGTDAACEGGLPGDALHQELAEMVAAGLTPLEALRTATLEPARYLDRKNAGRVATGMDADLLVLDANPLVDIANTRRIRAVVLDGRLLAGGEKH